MVVNVFVPAETTKADVKVGRCKLSPCWGGAS